MHAVRTPVFGIGLAFVLLLLETLGARAYIADRTERQAQVERRVRLVREGTIYCGKRPLPNVYIAPECLDNPLAKGCE